MSLSSLHVRFNGGGDENRGKGGGSKLTKEESVSGKKWEAIGGLIIERAGGGQGAKPVIEGKKISTMHNGNQTLYFGLVTCTSGDLKAAKKGVAGRPLLMSSRIQRVHESASGGPFYTLLNLKEYLLNVRDGYQVCVGLKTLQNAWRPRSLAVLQESLKSSQYGFIDRPFAYGG